jgi:hypothetical protein
MPSYACPPAVGCKNDAGRKGVARVVYSPVEIELDIAPYAISRLNCPQK